MVKIFQLLKRTINHTTLIQAYCLAGRGVQAEVYNHYDNYSIYFVIFSLAADLKDNVIIFLYHIIYRLFIRLSVNISSF